MQEVIPCAECARKLKNYGTGFTAGVKMRCARDMSEVSSDDGCTLGERGEGSYIKRATEAELAGHAAVYRDDECE